MTTKQKRGKAQQRLGRSQAKIASLKSTDTPTLTKKDKLKLGKAAAKNIVEGTIASNKEKEKEMIRLVKDSHCDFGAAIVLTFVGMVFGAAATVVVYERNKEQLTCESVSQEMWATRACLAQRPACPGISVDGLRRYHEIKDWSDVNCPDNRHWSNAGTSEQ